MGGMVGSMSAGVVSDALFDARRDITSAVYASLTIPALLGLAALCSAIHQSSPPELMPHTSMKAMLAVCMFCVGVGINGPKTLVGMCAREGVPSFRVGLTGGILGMIDF